MNSEENLKLMKMAKSKRLMENRPIFMFKMMNMVTNSLLIKMGKNKKSWRMIMENTFQIRMVKKFTLMNILKNK